MKSAIKNNRIKSTFLALAIATTSFTGLTTAAATSAVAGEYNHNRFVANDWNGPVMRGQVLGGDYIQVADNRWDRRAKRRAERRAERRAIRREERRAIRRAERRHDRRVRGSVRHNHNWDRHDWRDERRSKRHKRRRNAALGIAGVTLGAIILNEIARSNRNNYQQPQVYQAPRPTLKSQPAPSYNNPANDDYVVQLESSHSPEPWTHAWKQACKKKYRSFNVKKGTFRGYDGRDHFCVIK